jgi:hypothetical protein
MVFTWSWPCCCGALFFIVFQRDSVAFRPPQKTRQTQSVDDEIKIPNSLLSRDGSMASSTTTAAKHHDRFDESNISNVDPISILIFVGTVLASCSISLLLFGVSPFTSNDKLSE